MFLSAVICNFIRLKALKIKGFSTVLDAGPLYGRHSCTKFVQFYIYQKIRKNPCLFYTQVINQKSNIKEKPVIITNLQIRVAKIK